MDRLNIFLPAEEKELLKKIAEKRGLTMTDIIRQWITAEKKPVNIDHIYPFCKEVVETYET